MTDSSHSSRPPQIDCDKSIHRIVQVSKNGHDQTAAYPACAGYSGRKSARCAGPLGLGRCRPGQPAWTGSSTTTSLMWTLPMERHPSSWESIAMTTPMKSRTGMLPHPITCQQQDTHCRQIICVVRRNWGKGPSSASACDWFWQAEVFQIANMVHGFAQAENWTWPSRFIERHSLSPGYRDQIADFIVQNTALKRPIDPALNPDPFTGGGAYRPASTPAPYFGGQQNGSVTGGGVDPFTGLLLPFYEPALSPDLPHLRLQWWPPIVLQPDTRRYYLRTMPVEDSCDWGARDYRFMAGGLTLAQHCGSSKVHYLLMLRARAACWFEKLSIWRCSGQQGFHPTRLMQAVCQQLWCWCGTARSMQPQSARSCGSSQGALPQLQTPKPWHLHPARLAREAHLTAYYQGTPSFLKSSSSACIHLHLAGTAPWHEMTV